SAVNERISDGKYKVVASGTHEDGTIVTLQFSLAASQICVMLSSAGSSTFHIFPRNGMTSLPTTMINKCQNSAGEMQITAATYMPFSIRHLDEYGAVTASVFDNEAKLPLLGTMGELIKNGTFANLSANSTMVALTNIGSKIDFLACSSRWMEKPSDIALLCTYIIVDALITMPQPIDPVISAALGNKSAKSPDELFNGNVIDVSHFPAGSTGSMATFSVTDIINATSAAASYLASLGSNLVMDRDQEQLYILFDTFDVQNGYEFSTVHFVSALVVMILCGCLWAYTGIRFSTTYTGSLYKVIYAELEH
ncbi:hypothetical protein BGZ51_000755, partial [Haplosporangium sp. Z 767]